MAGQTIGQTVPSTTLSKEITQQDVRDLVDSVYTMVQSLSFLSSLRGNLADLRVNLTGGTTAVTGTLTGVTTVTTVTGVTTVSTLTNQTQIGGMNANVFIPSANNTSFYEGNLHNVTVS